MEARERSERSDPRAARGAFHLLPLDAAAGMGEAGAVPAPLRTPTSRTPARLRAPGEASLPAPVHVVPPGGELRLAGAGWVLRAVERHGRDALLVLAPTSTRTPASALRVNGSEAPGVAVLRPGDEVRLGPGAPLRVDFLRASPLATADEALARGSTCQLCRGAIRAGQSVYRCACGAVTHAETPENDGPDALSCAFGTCTACGCEIDPRAGYVHSGRAAPEESRVRP